MVGGHCPPNVGVAEVSFVVLYDTASGADVMVGPPIGRVVLGRGEREGVISVRVVEDEVPEENERLRIQLISTTGENHVATATYCVYTCGQTVYLHAPYSSSPSSSSSASSFSSPSSPSSPSPTPGDAVIVPPSEATLLIQPSDDPNGVFQFDPSSTMVTAPEGTFVRLV